jgi:ankyrin repeat protein
MHAVYRLDRGDFDGATRVVGGTLLECATAGDLAGVQQRLGEGADSNQKDGDGDTALTWASSNGHLAVVEALLAHGGCDVNHKTKNGITAFTLACGGGNSVQENKAKIQRLLLQNGCDATLLEFARAGDLAGVQQRLSEGADVNQEGSQGNTALVVASENGHLAVVEALLAHGGCNVDHKSRQAGGCNTALAWSSLRGHLTVVEALLQHGAEANGKRGGVAVRLASVGGHPKVVRLLAGRGAPLELTEVNGDTALSFAAREGHVEVVRALLELGVNAGWWSGKQARCEAKGNNAITQLLVNGHSGVSHAKETTRCCLDVLCGGERDCVPVSAGLRHLC